jgi:hypothetical protein
MRDLQKVSTLSYFQRKWKEWEGWGWGIVGCHVTSQQGKPVDFAVSMRVVTKWWSWQQNFRIVPRRNNDLWYVLCGQKVYKVNKFISVCVLSCRAVHDWTEMLKMAAWVLLMQSIQVVQPQPQLHRMKKELGNWFLKTEEWRWTKLQNNLISALGLPTLWCITFSSIECVPGGYLRDRWMSISACT